MIEGMTGRTVSAMWIACQLLVGCSSVDWQTAPRELPQEWRGRRLFVSEEGDVLATTAPAAEEAHARLVALAAEIEEVAGVTPGRFLAIVENSQDEPLVADPLEAMLQRARWQAAMAGKEPPPEERMREDALRHFGMKDGEGETLDFDMGLMVRLIASGVPRDETELGLPPELVDRAEWIVLMPSDGCVEAVLDEMIDVKLESEGHGFFARAAMKSAMVLAGLSVADEWWKTSQTLLITSAVAGTGGDAEAALAAFRERDREVERASRPPEKEFPKGARVASSQLGTRYVGFACWERAADYGVYVSPGAQIVDCRAARDDDLEERVRAVGGSYVAHDIVLAEDGRAREADVHWFDRLGRDSDWFVLVADSVAPPLAVVRAWAAVQADSEMMAEHLAVLEQRIGLVDSDPGDRPR